MNNKNSNGGIGLVGLLTIVFTVLKLTRVITWSWWWVLSPMWISILLLIVVLIIGMLLDG
ncbi:MAG: hypothetical protein V8T29_12160 [Oscillospiraceae bacterium]|mgnify:FL=1|jgi:hypothetical protein|nr:MAG TPA: transmembrane protein [Caudoviricetes sp.]